MWNFNYLIPSIMILSVFVGYYLSLPRLPIRKNIIFAFVVSSECLVMIADLVSTWADKNFDLFSPAILYLFNSSYFILFFARSFIFFIFTASVLNVNLFKFKWMPFVLELPINICILIVVSTPWTRLYYYIDQDGYHNGPLYNLIYILSIMYLAMSFFILFIKRVHIIRPREKYIIIWYNTIISAGLLFRYLFPKYLLMDIFFLMALIVIFLSFENPDSYLEERTFIFNRTALRDYINEINGSKSINALIFCIHNYIDNMELYGIQQMNQGVYLIENYLKQEFPDYLVFDYRNGRFVLFSKDIVDWKPVYAKIQQRFLHQWISKDTELYLDIGGSIISLPNKGFPFEIILRVFSEGFANADKNLSDEIAVYNDSIVDAILTENEIKHALDTAIAEDSVEVYLQPIVDSSTGKLKGAEALSRIRAADGHTIPPGLFIPIAEKNGKINPIGKQVFRKCCEFVGTHDMNKLGLEYINVNLSPLQFMKMDLDDTLNQITQNAGVSPDFIHLEITEESMIDEALMDKQINALKNKGFKFVLDDYGKGYSNMARLHRTPFINIKLDMSIVWDYCNNPDAILPNEVGAFSSTGFSITAEGIETEEMAIKMKEIGCTYLQGYYFSKPLPIKEFIEKYSCQS